MQKQGIQPQIKMWLFPGLTYAVITFISVCLIAMMFIPEYQILVISTGIAAIILMSIGMVLQYKQKAKSDIALVPSLKPAKRH